jgi:hypothetical protein
MEKKFACFWQRFDAVTETLKSLFLMILGVSMPLLIIVWLFFCFGYWCL